MRSHNIYKDIVFFAVGLVFIIQIVNFIDFWMKQQKSYDLKLQSESELSEAIVKEMKKHKIKVYATDLQTDKSIYDVDYEKSAIVIGNEANGVSKEVLEEASQRIKIPMLGKTESLNAAVATSIILYETFRSTGKIK